MSLSPSDIKIIIESLRASNWDEAVVTVGDTRIAVARNGKSVSSLLAGDSPGRTEPQAVAVSEPAPRVEPVANAAPQAMGSASGGATQAEEPSVDNGDHVIASPSVGVFWRSPEPGGAPFVEVGQLVQAGDTLGIVEIMKLMSNITADVSGVVTAIFVDNAGAVEHGTPLMSIKPEA